MATSKRNTRKPKLPDATTSSAHTSVAPKIKPAEVIVPLVSVVVGPATAITAVPASDGQPLVVKKQELVDRIVKASGAKKKDAKLIFEAALGVLGDALSAGEELNLPPLGKIRVNRKHQNGTADVLVLRLRRDGGKVGGGDEGSQDAPEQDSQDD